MGNIKIITNRGQARGVSCFGMPALIKTTVGKGLLFLTCFFYFCCAIASTHLTSIKKMRVTHTSLKTRFVFDGNNPIRYQKFQLMNPHRLIIDVEHAKILRPFHFQLPKKAPVKNIRVAKKNNNLRLIFDLKYLSKIKVFTLKSEKGKPYRLVVDFFGSTIPMNTVEKKQPRRDVIIAIDPGHGGKDPGAMGPNGMYEKNIVLAISKKLQNAINHQPGFRAILTRHRDVYLSLRQRLAIARHYNADMFVAIHADAYRNRLARGASVFALSVRGATSEAARWLAKRENESELMGGVNLSGKGNLLKSVLINLSQTATIRASLLIGEEMIHFLDRIAYLHHHSVEQAAFVVLKSPDIPSLLIETGFLSNRYEEQRLCNPAYQNRLALAIMKGIRHYFTQQPPRHTWLAYWRAHPRKETIKYAVHRGDTLTGIAQRYQVSVKTLSQRNHLRSLNLRVGQVLLIPKS